MFDTRKKLFHSNQLKFIICLLFIMCLLSCGKKSDQDNNPSSNSDINSQTRALNGELTVPDHLKGTWHALNGGTEIHLGTTTKYTINVVDENMIRLQMPNSTAFPATRFGSQKSKISMVVAKPSTIGTKGGVSGIGGLEVILQDLNDNDNHKTTQTDSNGNVKTDDVTSGDYKVTVAGNDTYKQTEITCQINGSADLAIVTPSEKGSYSFKSELMDSSGNKYTGFIYGDFATYTGWIYITNIGDIDAPGMKYKLSVDNNSNIIPIDDNETDLSAVIGTIEPGKTKPIKIKFKTRFLSDTGVQGDYFNDKINIILTDQYNKQWTHYVPIKIYRRSVAINIDSDQTSPYNSSIDLQGLIIFPDRYIMRIPSWKKFYIPLSSDTPYKIIFSNLSADKEQKYTIGIDTACNTRVELSQFTDTGKDELGVNGNTTGNETESTAILLKYCDKYIAYLLKQDIDYYLIDMKDAPKEPVYLIGVKDQYSIVDRTDSSLKTKGNNDKKISPGESVNLNFPITNTGTSTAYGVKVCLSVTSDDGYVIIPPEWSCTADYPSGIEDIASGILKDSKGYTPTTSWFMGNGAFLLQVSPSTPVGYQIGLKATITDTNGHQWIYPFAIPVVDNGAKLTYYPPPSGFNPVLDQFNSVSCPLCNNDGIINPGENIRLNIAIKNEGSSQANNVSATISLKNSSQSGVSITKATSDAHVYGDAILAAQIISCGGYSFGSYYFLSASSGNYQINFSPDITPGLVYFLLTMKDEFSNTWFDEFSLEVKPK